MNLKLQNYRLTLTAFQVWLSGESHQNEPYIWEVITWSIFDLSRAPLEAKFMYWLSSFQLSLGFTQLFSKIGLPLWCQPHYQIVVAHLGFGIWQLESKTNYLLSIFLNFESQCILHKEFCKRAAKITFKIEFFNVLN